MLYILDIEEELCDGAPPLINPRTGRDYDCQTGRDTCPSGSYCHKLSGTAKCCQEGMSCAHRIISCTVMKHCTKVCN